MDVAFVAWQHVDEDMQLSRKPGHHRMVYVCTSVYILEFNPIEILMEKGGFMTHTYQNRSVGVLEG